MKEWLFLLPVQGDGDTVTATVLPDRPGEVVITSIEGDGGRLSLIGAENCAGIAAIETLKLLGGQPSCGVSLRLKKACDLSCVETLLLKPVRV
jgi:homoserine kinase